MNKILLVLTVIIVVSVFASAVRPTNAQVLQGSTDSIINQTVRNIYTRLVAAENQISQLFIDISNIRTRLHGAGNIAFCSPEHGCSTVLKNDGTIWSISGQGNWVLVTDSVPNSVPVDVENIISWNMTQLLDENGDVWRWTNNTWVNMGHP